MQLNYILTLVLPILINLDGINISNNLEYLILFQICTILKYLYKNKYILAMRKEIVHADVDHQYIQRL